MTEKLLFTKKEIFRFEYFRKYPSFSVNLTMVAVSRVGFLVSGSNCKDIVSREQ